MKPSLVVLVAALGCAACSKPAPSFIGSAQRDYVRAGEAALGAGDLERAEDLLSRAVAAASAESDCRYLVEATRLHALVAERRADPESARSRHAAARDAAVRCGDLEGTFVANLAGARFLFEQGDFAAVVPLVERARVDSIAIGTLTARGEYLVLRARLALAESVLDEAEAAAREAVRTFDMQGPSLERSASHAEARRVLAAVLAARGDSIAAIAELRSAAALAHDAGDRRLEAAAQAEIADRLLALERAEDGRVWLEFALANWIAARDTTAARDCLARLEELARAAGRDDRLRGYRSTREKLAAGD